MALMVNGIRIRLSGLGGHIVALTGFADVAVDKDFAIQGDGNVVALCADLLVVPLAQRLMLDALGRNDAVDRAVDLIFAQALVDGIVVVEDLNLHAFIGCIHALAGADAHTVIDTRTHEAELEAEHEIGVFLGRIEIALRAVLGTYIDGAVDGHVGVLGSRPLVEVCAIEEEFEASLLLFG